MHNYLFQLRFWQSEFGVFLCLSNKYHVLEHHAIDAHSNNVIMKETINNEDFCNFNLNTRSMSMRFEALEITDN